MKILSSIFSVFLLAYSIAGAADQPKLVAHRGASYDAPENTIPAFLEAWKQGADAIEGDFYLTSDGEIIAHHDSHTQKTAGVKHVLKETPLKVLRELDVGKWKGEAWAGTRMPLLSEVFDIIPEGKKIFVEMKSGPEILPRFLEVFQSSKVTHEQVVVIAFDAEVIRQLKELDPKFKAYWLTGFKPKSKEDETLVPSTETVIETLKRIKADGLDGQAVTKLDPALPKAVMDAGFEYHVWTINTPEVAKQFIEYGASSVTTDRPAYLKKELSL